MNESIKSSLLAKNINMSIVPGGCTKYIHAPNFSWGKPFKALAMEKYNKWLEEEGINLETPARILKPLPHERMTSDVIKKSFKTFALNLLTAGSENNMVYVLKTISPASPEKKNTCSPPVVHALLKRWKFNYWYKWWRHRHGGASLYVDRLGPRGRWGHSNLLNTEERRLRKEVNWKRMG